MERILKNKLINNIITVLLNLLPMLLLSMGVFLFSINGKNITNYINFDTEKRNSIFYMYNNYSININSTFDIYYKTYNKI